MTAPTITTPGGLDQQGRAVAPVTIGNVTLPAGSTPAERQAAIIKANVQPHQGGIGHTSETMAEFARQAAKAPPSPAELEKANSMPTPEEQAAKVAEFDAQMRAKGLQQTRPDLGGREGLAVGEFDSQAADLLTLRLKQLCKPYDGKNDARSVAARGELLAIYERDMRSLYDGKQLSAQQLAEMAKRVGVTVPVASAIPKDKTPKPAEQPRGADGKFQSVSYTAEQTETALEVAAKASDAKGWADSTAITGPLLHGYSIPPGRYEVAEVVAGLRLARLGNLSQSQVDAILKGGA